ncbi:hypothetical protein MTR67_026478 [Solanum verrucosum]|uniref:Uncharacterized protein n=1 Tax=Solanum verrucosum TaxID=315347 RepID=A0AAF0R2X5_SOLVR|nr:hypothetical protein MTR67_026478 [Solanum verrucosum]
MVDFNVIFGMSWLSPSKAILDIHAKTVTLVMFGVPRVEWKDAIGSYPRKFIYFLRYEWLIDRGFLSYLAFIRDTNVEPPFMDSILVVREFFVAFLGHVMSKEGIRVDLTEIEVVRGLIGPTSPSKVRSFVGLDGYYRRIGVGGVLMQKEKGALRIGGNICMPNSIHPGEAKMYNDMSQHFGEVCTRCVPCDYAYVILDPNLIFEEDPKAILDGQAWKLRTKKIASMKGPFGEFLCLGVSYVLSSGTVFVFMELDHVREGVMGNGEGIAHYFLIDSMGNLLSIENIGLERGVDLFESLVVMYGGLDGVSGYIVFGISLFRVTSLDRLDHPLASMSEACFRRS